MQPSAPSTQMFSVNIDGETVAETWNKAVPMPDHLAKRVDQLEKRHHSTSPSDMENRMQQATQNYKENLENTKTKAHMATVKGENAKARRAEFGENMTLMGNAMGNKDQSVKLPKALSTRIATLSNKNNTTSSTIMSKQEKAAANRKAALEAKKMKAAVSTAKVAAAKAKKETKIRESMGQNGFYEVDVSADSASTKGGWNQNIPLPERLSKRVKAVNEKFDYDVMGRYNRTADNYQKKLDAIAAKAKIASERVEKAKQRRALLKGDENHFTVTASGEEKVASDNGWTAKPTLPPHLQTRLNELNTKHQKNADYFEKQNNAANKRAAFLADIAAKGKLESEKIEASKNRRAIAAGSATHFTVTEASFAATEEEGIMENKNGWGRQQAQKLPSHLQERLNVMKNTFQKEDMEIRQNRAANNRSEFQRSVAMKASAESDRVANVQGQLKLMKGDKNTFTVTFEGDCAAPKQGWTVKPPLPNALKDRLNALKAGTLDQPTKQARAAANRQKFLNEIVQKAAVENEKSMNAENRRLLAKGDENSLFSVDASEGDSSKAGWGNQSTRIPPHLQDRLTELTKKHAAKPHAIRQANAEQRRGELLRSVAMKAAMETDKVNNAISRKKLEAGDSNTFTVTLNGEESQESAQGWKQKNRLPARLAERLKSLGETFQMKPYNARVEKASAKRAEHLNSLATKASAENDKLAAAKSRRQLANGDDSHFTVASVEEDEVVQQHGWGFKPTIPNHLQKRLSTLNKRFGSREGQELKQARAAANRAKFQENIAKKAAYESEKCMNAKSQKALIEGNETLFTTNLSGEEVEDNKNGWGVKTALPKRLEERYKALNAKFHGTKDPMAKQRNAAQKRADFNNKKVLKAHESIERMFAAQSRKALQEGNESCFRVEFNEDKDTIEQGWGKTSPKLPKRLAQRAADLIKKSPTKNPFEQMNKATEKRDEYLSTLIAKAHQTSVKMEAARKRKLKNEMDAGIILLNVGQQRKMSPVKLPARLSERVEALTLKFGYNGAEKEKRVEENRQRRLNEVRHKASASAKRAAAAKERRIAIARQQQLERIQNATTIEEEEEDDVGCAKKAKKDCTIC